MSPTLEQVQPDEIMDGFLPRFQEMADRLKGDPEGYKVLIITKGMRVTVEALMDWMDKEGYAFGRKTPVAS